MSSEEDNDKVASSAPTKEELEAEAIAEEEFVAGMEDEIENPFVPDDETEPQEQEKEPAKEEEDLLAGSITSGDPSGAFNNEQALREEKMSEENEKVENTESVTPETPVASDENISATDGDNNESVIATEEASESIEAPVEEQPKEGPTEAAPAEPAEPAVATEPTATTEPVATAEPVVAAQAETPVVATAPVAVDAPKKKKKTGAIVAIVILAIAVIGGGTGAAAYMSWHESADKTVEDALSNFWNAEDMQADLEMTITNNNKDDKDNPIKAMKVTGKSVQAGTNYAFEDGKIVVETKKDGNIELDIAAAYANDESIYFKVGNISNATSKLFAVLKNVALEEGDVDEDEIDTMIELLNKMLDTTLKVLDGKWIVFSADSIEDEDSKEEFKCMLDGMKGLQGAEFKQKVADLFVESELMTYDDKVVKSENELSYYKLEIDKEKLKSFSEKIEELEAYKKLDDCSKSNIIYDTDDDDYDWGDWGIIETPEEDEDDENNEFEIKSLLIGVRGWSHELEAIEMEIYNPAEKTTVVLKASIKYEKKSVEIPGEAKSVEDIVEDLKKAIAEALPEIIRGYLEAQIRTACSEEFSTTAEINSCVDIYMKEYEDELDDLDIDPDEFDIEDMFGSMMLMPQGQDDWLLELEKLEESTKTPEKAESAVVED